MKARRVTMRADMMNTEAKAEIYMWWKRKARSLGCATVESPQDADRSAELKLKSLGT